MPDIVTITFNPCIDKSCSIDALVPDRKLRCTDFVNEPGGGGVNVARAITKLGGEAHAIFLAGGYPGNLLQQLLRGEGVPFIAIETDQDTRENMMVTDRSTGLQYRFVTAGNAIPEKYWKECLDIVAGLDKLSYLVVSGSLQPGFPPDLFGRLARIASQKEARLVLDVPAESILDHPVTGAYLLKPNLGELSMLAGKEQLNGTEIAGAARALIAHNTAEVILVSMGAAGALLVTRENAEHFIAPPVKRVSTVGAGDSMVAGTVLYLHEGKSLREAVRYGIACGTAATLNTGTQLCTRGEADQLYRYISDIPNLAYASGDILLPF